MNTFYYDRLSQNEQKYYNEIIKGLRNNWHEIVLYGLKDIDVLMKCIEAVKYDFVDLFYVNFSCITSRGCNDYLEYLPEYIYEGKERERKVKKVETVILDIIANMPQDKKRLFMINVCGFITTLLEIVSIIVRR